MVVKSFVAATPRLVVLFRMTQALSEMVCPVKGLQEFGGAKRRAMSGMFLQQSHPPI